MFTICQVDFYHVRTHQQTLTHSLTHKPVLIYHFKWLPTRAEYPRTSTLLNNSHTEIPKRKTFSYVWEWKCLSKFQRNISWFECMVWCDGSVCDARYVFGAIFYQCLNPFPLRNHTHSHTHKSIWWSVHSKHKMLTGHMEHFHNEQKNITFDFLTTYEWFSSLHCT